METWIICVSFLWFVQQSSPIGQRSRSGLHDNSYYCLSCVVDWNIFVHHSETVAQLLPTLATFDIWFIRRFLLMHISNRNLLILIEEVPKVEEKSNFEDFHPAYYNIFDYDVIWFYFQNGDVTGFGLVMGGLLEMTAFCVLGTTVETSVNWILDYCN